MTAFHSPSEVNWPLNPLKSSPLLIENDRQRIGKALRSPTPKYPRVN